jgi:hypothetical protein
LHRSGGLEIWWTVDATRPDDALGALLSASAPHHTPHIGNRPSNDRRTENGNEHNYSAT